jgi:hypothetical protein
MMRLVAGADHLRLRTVKMLEDFMTAVMRLRKSDRE